MRAVGYKVPGPIVGDAALVDIALLRSTATVPINRDTAVALIDATIAAAPVIGIPVVVDAAG